MKSGLERRGRGLYYDPKNATYIVRVMVNGRRVERSFDTRRQAEQVRLALKNQKVATDLGIIVPGSVPNVGEVLRRYINDAEARGLMWGTIENYERMRRRLLDVFGQRKPIRLTTGDVGEYIRERRKAGASARAITDELRFFRFAVRSIDGPASIAWAMPRLYDPDERAPKPVPTDAEVAELITHLRPRPEYHRLALLCLLTALRIGDVRRLTDANIIDGCIVTGMHKRRGSPIAVPMVPTLATALKGVRGPLTIENKRRGETWLRNNTAELSRQWYGTGIFRHVAATWSSEAGFGDEQIGILLGHSTRSVARRHYIRTPGVMTSGSTIDLRREMLEHVEARLIRAIFNTKNSPNDCAELPEYARFCINSDESKADENNES